MAPTNPDPSARASILARENIYTILVMIAFVALLTGVIYVWTQSASLFDTANPFAIAESGK